MKHDVVKQAKKHAQEHNNRKRWYQIFISLALIVVFGTIYALSLPATTMEKGQCDIPEHTHDASCYKEETIITKTPVCNTESLNIHTHTKECYDEKQQLICGYADYIVHEHDDTCYDEDGKLWCPLPEIKAHTHQDSCYETISDAKSEALRNSGYKLDQFKLRCTLAESEEHQHTEACYDLNQVLTCDQEEIILHKHTKECYDENGNLICGKTEVLEHEHNDDCFETKEETKTTDELICGKEEHKHDLTCYSDLEADVETEKDWKATFQNVKLSGDKAADLVAIAKTQVGYTESTKNYQVMEDGSTIKGYTRYGQWYDNPYGDWDAMFASFCLHYANITEIPADDDSNAWVNALKADSCNRFESAGTYEPQTGDLIFFDTDGDKNADHVGIIAETITDSATKEARLRVIEGDAENEVRYTTCYESDTSIIGYGKVSGLKGEKEEDQAASEATSETAAEATTPAGDAAAENDETSENKADKTDAVKNELTYDGPDYHVHVSYGEDAGLPEGVTLAVKEIEKDSREYNEYYEESLAAVEEETKDDTVLFARFFDVSFRLNGETIEPTGPVEVTITYDENVETGDDVNCQSIHFAKDGLEILDAKTDKPNETTTSFTHTQNSFSVTGTVVTGMSNPMDIGPDKFPVDYYVYIDDEWVCVGSTKTGWQGDYNAGSTWTNTNRDCISVAQAASILGDYGFITEVDGYEWLNQIGYQRKETYLNSNVYNDTTYYTKNYTDGETQKRIKVIPLSRNSDDKEAGYNVYFLPGNTEKFANKKVSALNLNGSRFYTVNVYGTQGNLLQKVIQKQGTDFTYTATDNTASWRVVNGTNTTVVNGNSITVSVQGKVSISPNKESVVAGSHNVTFKVLIDGEWQEVGSLPYYYSGTIDNQARAYITSDMAAQFFGKFGYEATADPGKHFGYSYNDIYEIAYYSGAETKFCMDIAGGSFSDGTVVQLYTEYQSKAQKFRIWKAGSTSYNYITPLNHSGFYVNAYGGTTADNTIIKLSTASDIYSQWKVVNNTNGTVCFYNAYKDSTACIDLDSNNQANGAKLQIYNDGSNRYWKLNQLYSINNNTVSEKKEDGTYKIGLTPESNGDIVCYYLPEENNNTISDKSEIDLVSSYSQNGFYSVKVVDDTHTVYSELQLKDMVQYVQSGKDATVTVQNANGILWSCHGKNGGEVTSESTQSGGYTTFTIKNITQPIEVVATKANPSFTVQYYGNIPRFAQSGSNALTVIDTSGKQLPTNGGSMATKNLYLNGTGQYTNQNNGDATQLYTLNTTTELTKLYSENQYEYESSPDLYYFNKLKDNESYTLNEIWILKAGKDPSSKTRSDWTIYSYNSDIKFTNEASQVNNKTILIQEGTVIRLVSDSSSSDYYNDTTFYDYNISSGQNNDGRWRTGITGINIESNYGTSRNGQSNWRSGADILAFGNRNCGTGMSGYLFDGGPLNKYNSTNSNYGGATFELTSGLNNDGTIKYNEWIVAPKLFNEGSANGKQTYSGSSLTFNRVGDTYTLSSATLKNSNGQSNTLSGLQYFFNPSPTSGTTHSHIFTNNFWPMDKAAGRTDALWGKYGSTGTFQGFEETNGYNWSGLAANFPQSDDGNNHNWFFGMNFSLNFNLTADYEGPLEYYFFGDDDLWVFLDGKLICDIGGVHSSIGEFVNLRDYLPVGSTGQHKLSFFYTERGASGSTCYMSFTLPSVSEATTRRDVGSLQLSKKVENVNKEDNNDVTNEEYRFKVELLTEANGSPLNSTFSYSKTDGTYGTVKSGGTIAMKANETATITGIPAGTYYRVTELTTDGYKPTVNGQDGYITTGTIVSGGTKPANFVNKTYTELPQTGGSGTIPYTMGGLLFVTIASLTLMYRYKKRRREA